MVCTGKWFCNQKLRGSIETDTHPWE